MARPLLLATRSAHKAEEIRRILAPLRVQVESLADLGVEPDPDEESIEVHHTFRQNALAKALWFAARTGRVTLADDSGLRVDALDGAPGVHTKRFSGRTDLEGQPLDHANNQLLLQKLEDVADEQRGAHYVCCAAAAWPPDQGRTGRSLAATGTVRGRIARDARGQGGFGYDPLFHVPGLDARFAEVAADVKNEISHRARAFRALAPLLARSPWPL